MCIQSDVVQLKRVLVKNFLSFEYAEFLLGPYTVIVGPNNSGKTNLLRILSMISKNGNFEYLQINRTQKLNPDEPSEIVLTLNLDKTETGMAFQCIFGQNSPADVIAEDMRTLDITIFWDKGQSVVISPKFTLYQFGNGFTIATSQHHPNIAFDAGRILLYPDGYESEVDSWRTAKLENLFTYTDDKYRTLQYADLPDKEPFMKDILEGRFFDTAYGQIIEGLPIPARHDSNADTQISRLIRRHNPPQQYVDNVSLGVVLNMIFKDNITLIGEIHPSYEELSNSLATLRNREQDKYSGLRKAFEEISGGVEVLVERGQDGTERILFVEGDKRYGIDNSASGHHALTGILYMMLGRTSGLVAIDEPEVHLHPTMCLRLHKMLTDRMDRNGVQIVIVTHSIKFVTHEQIKRPCEHGLIMVTRRDSASQVHADTKESAPEIQPHLFNPEIFFGKCTLMVEGSSDYFTMKAISDHHDGLLGRKDIVLMHCNGKDNLPAFIDLHKRFNIPYQAMADSDYYGVQDGVIKLPDDLEAELKIMGVSNVPTKADDGIYDQVVEFLKEIKTEDWMESKFWHVFEETIDKADGKVPV